MNFVIFSAQYLPTVGGIERYTNSLAKKLIEKGHRITVVTSSLQDVPNRETDSDGIDIWRIPVKWIMNRRFSIPIPNGEFRRMAKQLAQTDFDFAIIQTRFYLNSLWASRFCKKNGIPFQIFANRSDMPGGSTLGNISGSQLAVQGADIGLAQLAMHSSYETAACADSDAMVDLTRVFFGD